MASSSQRQARLGLAPTRWYWNSHRRNRGLQGLWALIWPQSRGKTDHRQKIPLCTTRFWRSPDFQINTILRKTKTIIIILQEAILWIIITAIKKRTNGGKWQMPIHSSPVKTNTYFIKEWSSAIISIAPSIPVINALWTIEEGLITGRSLRSFLTSKLSMRISHRKQHGMVL